jgi:Mg/Co/Ni transporter MgtE
MSNESFVINDIDYFTNYSRRIIFDSYGQKSEENSDTSETDLIDHAIDNLSQKDKEELDRILSYEEALNIVKSIAKVQTHKTTKEKRYVITDVTYMEILQSLGDRMTSNILNGLVNKGIVDTAYDSDIDDFVFWVKDKDNNK